MIEHAENQGVGGAIATGYARCRELGVDVTCVMAADNQIDRPSSARSSRPWPAASLD